MHTAKRASGLIGFYFLFGKPVESVNGGQRTSLRKAWCVPVCVPNPVNGRVVKWVLAYLAEESPVRTRLCTASRYRSSR